MSSQDELIGLMLDLKCVEAELKCALNKGCRRDKVELATKRLHEVTKRLDIDFWERIEKER